MKKLLSSFGVLTIITLSTGALTAMAATKGSNGMAWNEFSSEVDVVSSDAVEKASSGGIGMQSLWDLD